MAIWPRAFLRRLRSRLLRREVHVWYDRAYRLPVSGLEVAGMEPRRADFAAFWLGKSGAVAPASFRAPRRVALADLARVHSPELLESLGRAETLGRVFAADASDVPVDEVMATVRLACGGTLQAARETLLTRRPALNLLGGFHHAAPAAAGGYCPVNDIAVAVAALRQEGFGGRVAVLDLDAHPPDGTAACLGRDPWCWIGSLSGSDWGRLPGVDEVVLPEGAGDAEYLDRLGALLGRMPRPDLAFVVAGGDVLAGDRMGRLGLTLDGARRRDLRVAAALDGLPAVWLPGGGYHPGAWRVLAGTGMALAAGTLEPIPPGYDPLIESFQDIARSLTPDQLGRIGEVSLEDVEEELGLRSSRQRPLLGYYTAAGLEYAFHRYGIFEMLGRLGYSNFRVPFDRAGPGERLRLFGEADGAEHLLVEAILERRQVAGHGVLYVHWLTLRHPRARFSEQRPALPGQDVPGLGLGREAGELLAIMALRLGLAAVVYRPAHYHTAFPARHYFAFVDPERQGRFEALVRDLSHLPLGEATRALDEGRVLIDGRPYRWEADQMAFWLSESPDQTGLAAHERDRVRFSVLPPGAPRPPEDPPR